jgi:hypothetical protein
MIKFHSDMPCGGFCNVVMQNLALSLIGQKLDLKVQYNFISGHDSIPWNKWQNPPGNCDLGILNKNFNLFCGGREFDSGWIEVSEFGSDLTVEKLMQMDFIDFPIVYNGYGQKSCLLYNDHGESDLLSKTINKNPIEHYNKVFVHVRLGDQEQNNVGSQYYERCLRDIGKFESGIISSDCPQHPIVQYLSSAFNLEIFNPDADAWAMDFREVVDYASRFEYRIVTGGSSGWMIGMLGDNYNVYYIKDAYYWPAELFFNPKWKGF